jgi:hypothetical protein
MSGTDSRAGFAISQSHDERVIGILTTGPADISSMRQLVTEALRKPVWHVDSLANYARAKDSEPIYIANCGPIIRKPFKSGKRSVGLIF